MKQISITNCCRRMKLMARGYGEPPEPCPTNGPLVIFSPFSPSDNKILWFPLVTIADSGFMVTCLKHLSKILNDYGWLKALGIQKKEESFNYSLFTEVTTEILCRKPSAGIVSLIKDHPLHLQLLPTKAPIESFLAHIPLFWMDMGILCFELWGVEAVYDELCKISNSTSWYAE